MSVPLTGALSQDFCVYRIPVREPDSVRVAFGIRRIVLGKSVVRGKRACRLPRPFQEDPVMA